MTADRLLLLRHGRTASNVEQRFQGQIDVPLDDVGLVQAERVAVALQDWLSHEGSGGLRIVSSDLQRTLQTATPLAERLGLPVELDAGLRERSAGRWEGLLRPEARALDPELFEAWTSGQDVAVGGGETLSEAGRRAGAALAVQLGRMDGGLLVAVGHGASGRGGLARLLGLPGPSGGLDLLANCHWAVLRRRGDEWLLVSYNVGAVAADVTG